MTARRLVVPMSDSGHSRRNGNVCNEVRPTPKQTSLDQLQALHARVPVAADDDVIVYGNAQWFRDLDNHPRHLDVRARRCRVSSGMVVQENTVRPMALMALCFWNRAG